MVLRLRACPLLAAAALALTPAAAGAASSAPPKATTAPAVPATTAPAPAATTPTATTTTPASTTPPGPSGPAATTPAPPTSTTPAVPVHRGSHHLSAAAVGLIAFGALLVLVGLALLLVRWRAWEPEWLLDARHAFAEAGYRTGMSWAEFRDWLGHAR